MIRTTGSFAGSLVECSAIRRFRLFLCRCFRSGSAGRRAAVASVERILWHLLGSCVPIGYLEIGKRCEGAAGHGRHAMPVRTVDPANQEAEDAFYAFVRQEGR